MGSPIQAAGGRLSGKVALVTGAALGERAALGAAFAKALAAEGASVAVADIRENTDLARAIEAAGGTALPLSADVSDPVEVAAMVGRVIERFGRLDILVNNAGIGSNMPPIPLEELSVEDWDRLMAVNVRGPFLCVKAALPQMRRQGYGKIVNIGSTTMMTGLPNRLHYVSAKGAVLAMTRALATELGRDGIRVNAAAFGLVNSPMTQEVFRAEPEREAQMLGKRPLPLHYDAEDLAQTIVYLASSDSDHMTGQCLVVNSGEFYY